MGELWSAGPAALLPEEPRRGRSRRAGRRTRSVSQTPEGYRGAEESGFLRRIVSLSTYTAAILVAGAVGALTTEYLLGERISREQGSRQQCSKFRPFCPVEFQPKEKPPKVQVVGNKSNPPSPKLEAAERQPPDAAPKAPPPKQADRSAAEAAMASGVEDFASAAEAVPPQRGWWGRSRSATPLESQLGATHDAAVPPTAAAGAAAPVSEGAAEPPEASAGRQRGWWRRGRKGDDEGVSGDAASMEEARPPALNENKLGWWRRGGTAADDAVLEGGAAAEDSMAKRQAERRQRAKAVEETATQEVEAALAEYPTEQPRQGWWRGSEANKTVDSQDHEGQQGKSVTVELTAAPTEKRRGWWRRGLGSGEGTVRPDSDAAAVG
mmetsp:Transcript_42528/g.107522  ORF Transcript_42528/g.107522 Transcript_42528/m.107522 type:complete len:381 (-) Transcript_42528:122-1264(-)